MGFKFDLTYPFGKLVSRRKPVEEKPNLVATKPATNFIWICECVNLGVETAATNFFPYLGYKFIGRGLLTLLID